MSRNLRIGDLILYTEPGKENDYGIVFDICKMNDEDWVRVWWSIDHKIEYEKQPIDLCSRQNEFFYLLT